MKRKIIPVLCCTFLLFSCGYTGNVPIESSMVSAERDAFLKNLDDFYTNDSLLNSGVDISEMPMIEFAELHIGDTLPSYNAVSNAEISFSESEPSAEFYVEYLHPDLPPTCLNDECLDATFIQLLDGRISGGSDKKLAKSYGLYSDVSPWKHASSLLIIADKDLKIVSMYIDVKPDSINEKVANLMWLLSPSRFGGNPDSPLFSALQKLGSVMSCLTSSLGPNYVNTALENSEIVSGTKPTVEESYLFVCFEPLVFSMTLLVHPYNSTSKLDTAYGYDGSCGSQFADENISNTMHRVAGINFLERQQLIGDTVTTDVCFQTPSKRYFYTLRAENVVHEKEILYTVGEYMIHILQQVYPVFAEQEFSDTEKDVQAIPSDSSSSVTQTSSSEESTYDASDFLVLLPNSTVDGPLSLSRSKDEILIADGGRWPYFSCITRPPVSNFSIKPCPPEEFAHTTIEILKGSTRHALYENVFDGLVSDDGVYIALKNAKKQSDDVYLESLRIIDIASKESVALPLTNCTQNISNFSAGHLVTTSNISGDGFVDICVWNLDGDLIAHLHGNGFAFGSADRTISALGVLPDDPNVLYTVIPIPLSNDVFVPGCLLVLRDLKVDNSKEVVLFEHHMDEVYSCNGDQLKLNMHGVTMENAHNFATDDSPHYGVIELF